MFLLFSDCAVHTSNCTGFEITQGIYILCQFIAGHVLLTIVIIYFCCLVKCLSNALRPYPTLYRMFCCDEPNNTDGHPSTRRFRLPRRRESDRVQSFEMRQPSVSTATGISNQTSMINLPSAETGAIPKTPIYNPVRNFYAMYENPPDAVRYMHHGSQSGQVQILGGYRPGPFALDESRPVSKSAERSSHNQRGQGKRSRARQGYSSTDSENSVKTQVIKPIAIC